MYLARWRSGSGARLAHKPEDGRSKLPLAVLTFSN